MAKEILWNDLAGKTVKGWHNDEYDSYSTTLGKKDKDGKWDNMYLNIFFTKNVKVGKEVKIAKDNSFEITIAKGWLSHYNGKMQIIVDEVE